jgi:hypothetical protein
VTGVPAGGYPVAVRFRSQPLDRASSGFKHHASARTSRISLRWGETRSWQGGRLRYTVGGNGSPASSFSTRHDTRTTIEATRSNWLTAETLSYLAMGVAAMMANAGRPTLAGARLVRRVMTAVSEAR